MTKITTRRNNTVDTDRIEEFRIEEFADRSVVLRAYGHRKNGSYFNQPITPRIARADAVEYAGEVKPEAEVKALVRTQWGWEWRAK
jgi:hypothetical protein